MFLFVAAESEDGKDEGESTGIPSTDDAHQPSKMPNSPMSPKSSTTPKSPALSDVSNEPTEASENKPVRDAPPTPDISEQTDGDDGHSKDVAPTRETDAEGSSAEDSVPNDTVVTDSVSPNQTSPCHTETLEKTKTLEKETPVVESRESSSTSPVDTVTQQDVPSVSSSPDVSPSPAGKMQRPDEQPLDLSLKSKPRDVDEDDFDAYETTRTFTPQVEPLVIKPVSPVRSVASGLSSLANLEKRFGGDSVLLRQEQSRSQAAFRPTAFTSFGGNIYSSALYNIQPKQFPTQLKPAPTHSHLASAQSFCRASEVSVKPYLPKAGLDVNKMVCASESMYVKPDTSRIHTHLSCSCGQTFDTLVGLTVHLQETGHPAATDNALHTEYPKLVRGQDMWLNHGSEQTAQILRCMQCGKSFKSLPELTVHMIDTKHYTNIVGPEPHRNLTKYLSYGGDIVTDQRKFPQLYSDGGGSTTDRGLYKCRVCGRMFEDVDGLTYHMVVTNHHKRRSEFSDTDSDTASVASSLVADDDVRSAVRSSGKKRRLSVKNERGSPDHYGHASADDSSTIRCINCGEEKDTASFVDHVRICVKQISINRSTTAVSRRSVNTSESDSGMRVGDLVKPADVDSKARLGQLVKPPVSSRHSDDRLASPPVAGEGTRDGCALSQMESFIAKSFTYSHLNNNRYGVKNSRHHQPTTARLPSPSANGVALPATTGPVVSYKQKYVQPFDSSPSSLPTFPPTQARLPPPPKDLIKEVKIKEETHDPDYELNGIKESSCYDGRCEANGVADVVQKQEQHHQQQQRQQERQQQAKQLQEKYLRDETTSSPAVSEERKLSTSALSSLQGLVYGQPLSSEHPIDSLEKLLHDTAATAASLMSPSRKNGDDHLHDSIASSAALLQHGIPGGTVILVNPIVTVLPGGSASTPSSVHISMPLHGDCSPGEQHSPSKTSPPIDGSMEPIEPCRCPACKRTFASKGSYRYHLSRCHLGTKRFSNSGFKEVFSKSPYVYLPLDHATKFNRYYKMANELANNGK